jgi:hypothetical protein
MRACAQSKDSKSIKEKIPVTKSTQDAKSVSRPPSAVDAVPSASPSSSSSAPQAPAHLYFMFDRYNTIVCGLAHLGFES